MPSRLGFFLFIPGAGIRRDDRVEPESLVDVPNVPGLNPKSLCRTFVVKAICGPNTDRDSSVRCRSQTCQLPSCFSIKVG